MELNAKLVSISFIVIVRLRFKFSVHGGRAFARDLVASGGRNSLASNRLIGVAMTDSAHRAGLGCEWFRTRLRPNGPPPSRPRLLTISVIVLAMGLAGCARDASRREVNLGQQQVRAKPVRVASHLASRAHTHSEPRQHVELRVRRPDPALLAAQPAPNCEFKRADIKAVDPDEWARLKIEYERQCYQDAEMAARDRLRQLQASSLCEVERVPATTSRSSATSARPRP